MVQLRGEPIAREVSMWLVIGIRFDGDSLVLREASTREKAELLRQCDDYEIVVVEKCTSEPWRKIHAAKVEREAWPA